MGVTTGTTDEARPRALVLVSAVIASMLLLLTLATLVLHPSAQASERLSRADEPGRLALPASAGAGSPVNYDSACILTKHRDIDQRASGARAWPLLGHPSSSIAPPGLTSAPRGPLAPNRASVNAIAERGGVGLDGVKVHVLDPIADADTIRYLAMQGALAGTDDLGIQLHPGAFADEETLLRTLAHERTHVYQIQTFPNYGTGHVGAFEEAAYGIEDSFWQYFLRGGQ